MPCSEIRMFTALEYCWRIEAAESAGVALQVGFNRRFDTDFAAMHDAIAAGARSPAQVHRHHDTTINCGKCCETVCGMIREAGANDACSPQHALMAAE